MLKLNIAISQKLFMIDLPPAGVVISVSGGETGVADVATAWRHVDDDVTATQVDDEVLRGAIHWAQQQHRQPGRLYRAKPELQRESTVNHNRVMNYWSWLIRVR